MRDLTRVFAIILVFVFHISAHSSECEDALSGFDYIKYVLEHESESDLAKAYNTLDQRPDIADALGPRISRGILGNRQMPIFQERLAKLILALDKSTTEGADLTSEMETQLSTILEGKVLERLISSMIGKLSNKAKSTDDLLRALGNMSLEEVQEFTYGADPLDPSPESLIGRYIEETGAATVVRTFRTGPESDAGQGLEKLVVAVGSSSFEKYKELFSLPEFYIHVHTPGQGTLYTAHEGRYGAYAVNANNLEFQSQGALLPHILLKTTESNRLRNYFNYVRRFDYSYMLTPWSLTGYCATGGYRSCTHWVGNIPIGDKQVDEYWFPGKVDRYAGNNVPSSPQHQKLADYSAALQGIADENQKDHIRSIWTVPGHEQLADTLGHREENLAGEFANPGYVAYVLISRVSTDRVPVVFYLVNDHTQPISKNFDEQIRAY